PFSANQLRTGERAGALRHLADLIAQAAATAPLKRVVAGVTALAPDSAEAELLTATIADASALARSDVRVMPDIHTAYLAAFRPGEGVLVYAGTGSIGLHLGRGGDELR